MPAAVVTFSYSQGMATRVGGIGYLSSLRKIMVVVSFIGTDPMLRWLPCLQRPMVRSSYPDPFLASSLICLVSLAHPGRCTLALHHSQQSPFSCIIRWYFKFPDELGYVIQALALRPVGDIFHWRFKLRVPRNSSLSLCLLAGTSHFYSGL
jgi:hypothetical protein